MNKLIIAAALLMSCSSPSYKEPHVLIETNLGDIELELYPDKAPKTVAAFLSNIDAGLYNDGSFYRVLKVDDMPSDFNPGLIQGGTYKSAEEQQKIPGIPHEGTNKTGLSHKDGIISMARKDTGTATTEFFICIGDQSPLDYGNGGNGDKEGFAAFGKVFKGMGAVKKIQNRPSHGQSFDEKITIRKIKKL